MRRCECDAAKSCCRRDKDLNTPSCLPLLSFVLTFPPEIVNMSNLNTEKSNAALEVEAQPSSTGGPVYDVDHKVDYNRSGAIDAEKIEFNMTVLEAVKAYPAASWWAFVMSATIVSSCP
jgi:hypothetical protein